MQFTVEIEIVTKDEVLEELEPDIRERTAKLSTALAVLLRRWDPHHPHNCSVFINWRMICQDLEIPFYLAEPIIKAIMDGYAKSKKWTIHNGAMSYWYHFS